MKQINKSYISQLKHLKRYTTDPELAKKIAELSGKKPIDHVSPRLRKSYLKAWPDLSKKPGCAIQ